MEKFFDHHRDLGPTIIRVGLAVVFLWFGYNLVSNPADWTRQVPDYVAEIAPLSTETIVMINGIFEIVLGLALLVGFWTRTVAFLLAIHLIPIVINFGPASPNGARDFGILMATLGLSFLRPGRYSIDKKKE